MSFGARATKILATLGPSSDSPATIRQLLLEGVDVFRLNASYGTRDEHAARIRAARGLSAELGKHTGILLDLQGPKIRLGRFEGGQATLATGARFTITTQPVLGTSAMASTTYQNLARDVRPGDRVLLADGGVELRVAETDDVSVICHVVSGGAIGDSKGINLPGVCISSPSLTEKDINDLEFGIAQGVEFVALSFVRTGEDVRQLRRHLHRHNARLPVIAKIEKPEAWLHFEEILELSDGVMVARGDLGVETALNKVPAMQKSIIEGARRRGRLVITATQMLESMIEHPVPTRAEVSDVANAIYDGTDALMLSAETAGGQYPVEAVRMMAAIAVETESSIRQRGFTTLPENSDGDRDHARIVAEAAYHAARSAGVAALVVFTASGFSARMIARYRPPVPIYAFTPDEAVARRLALAYGVIPLLAPNVQSTDEMLRVMERTLIETGRLKLTDDVVFVAGQPVGIAGTTNLIKLHSLGAPQRAEEGKRTEDLIAAAP
jgi:pyruvate kinase